MIVKMRTAVATVDIAFSSSRNAALNERKLLQYTTLSMKIHHYTLSELKTQLSSLSDVLACLSIHCADQKQYSNPDLFQKSLLLIRCKHVLPQQLSTCRCILQAQA